MGEPDYKNSVKNRWRSRTWSNIMSRLGLYGCEPARSLGLYMPGPRDLDRRHAVMRSGIRPYNLIGVDKDVTVIKQMRGKGNLAIQSNLIDVLTVWPKSKPLQFVHADLCCGLNESVGAFVSALFSPQFIANKYPTIFCINLQRGRDQQSNWLRDEYKILSTMSDVYLNPETTISPGYLQKHRGAQLALLIRYAIIKAYPLPRPPMEQIIRSMWCDVGAYRAARVYMDSLIFTWAFSMKPSGNIVRPKQVNKKVSSRINATLAVRSMKINGTAKQAAVR